MNFLQRIKKLYYPIVKLVTQRSNKFGQAFVNSTNQQGDASFYDLEVTNLKGEKQAFSDFRNKKVLLVNVASNCGFTAQYDELEALNKNHPDLVVLGFPANNFGGQEPGSDAEIEQFCRLNFGVSFPVFHKADVVGENQQPVYQWLSQPQKNGWNDHAPSWNFCKYLVNEKGVLTHMWGSAVSPLSKEVEKAVQQ
jgi:glutathione peroxidase